MNLAIFFEPLAEELYLQPSNPKTFGASIDPFIHKFPDWRQADIAVIGINETRGTGQETNPEIRPAAAVRRQLYALKKRNRPLQNCGSRRFAARHYLRRYLPAN